MKINIKGKKINLFIFMLLLFKDASLFFDDVVGGGGVYERDE